MKFSVMDSTSELAYLQAQTIGHQHQLRILASDAHRNRFFECDDVKNVYGG
jgi:hypothetical protein